VLKILKINDHLVNNIFASTTSKMQLLQAVYTVYFGFISKI